MVENDSRTHLAFPDNHLTMCAWRTYVRKLQHAHTVDFLDL